VTDDDIKAQTSEAFDALSKTFHLLVLSGVSVPCALVALSQMVGCILAGMRGSANADGSVRDKVDALITKFETQGKPSKG